VLGKNGQHLSGLVEGIIEDGGEGVILRKVASLYEFGRSSSLIKLKVHILLYSSSPLSSSLLFSITHPTLLDLLWR
jgi:hypothetical protein